MKPSKMSERPPVMSFTYTSAEGNPQTIRIGSVGVTEIREVEENGEYCLIPWLEVWRDGKISERFNQHNVDHIFYRRGGNDDTPS